MEPSHDVFNRFCRVIDNLIRPLDKKVPVASAITRFASTAPVFLFDAAREEVVKEVAKGCTREERYLPPNMPFPEVILGDTGGVVMLLNATDYEDGEKTEIDPEGNARPVLRDMYAVVYTHSITEKIEGNFSLMIGRIFTSAPMEGAPNRQFFVHDLDCWHGVVDGEQVLHYAHVGMHDGLTMPQPLPEGAADPEIRKHTEEVMRYAYKRDFVASIDMAMDELHVIDLPKYYMVVETPKHVADNPQRAGRAIRAKTPRINDRPRVLVVDQDSVHLIYKAPEAPQGTHASPTPHPRRGYTRTLRSERFSKKRWSIVRVHPTWVGPEEWDKGRINYRVVIRGA